MDNDEFSTVRSRRQFGKFISGIEEIGEMLEDPKVSKSDLDQRVAILLENLKKEHNRSLNQDKNPLDAWHNEPGLNETIMYVEKYFEASSVDEAQNALDDAGTSLSYYLDQIKT